MTWEFPPDVGGISKSAKRITSFLSESNFEVYVFTPCYKKIDGDFFEEIVSGSIHVYRVNCLGSVDHDEQFYRVIKTIDEIVHFDIFHGFHLFKAYPCLEIAGDERPLIASFRGIDAIWMSKYEFAEKALKILEKASWITSVSEDILKSANRLTDISSKASFIPNSIFASKVRWQLSASNRGVVGTVATFRAKKNIPLLLDSYVNIPNAYRKKLLLVGDFVINRKKDLLREKSFKKMMDYLHISTEVDITGIIDNENVNSYLSKMNVFVLSSSHEGLPNSVLEAIAFGVPVVSTCVDGVKDLFEDGRNALLVPQNDMIGLRNAITEVLKNDELALRLSRGAEELCQRLTPDREKQAWLNLYQSLLNKKHKQSYECD